MKKLMLVMALVVGSFVLAATPTRLKNGLEVDTFIRPYNNTGTLAITATSISSNSYTFPSGDVWVIPTSAATITTGNTNLKVKVGSIIYYIKAHTSL